MIVLVRLLNATTAIPFGYDRVSHPHPEELAVLNVTQRMTVDGKALVFFVAPVALKKGRIGILTFVIVVSQIDRIEYADKAVLANIT